MKNFNRLSKLFFFLVLYSFIFSCQEESVEVPIQQSNSTGNSITKENGRSAVLFDGTEGDPIDYSLAKNWISNFKSKNTNDNEIIAHYFGNEIINQILNQSGCIGIRIYYALDDVGDKKLILVGVNAKGENILPNLGGRSTDGEEPVTADASLPCPDYCPPNGF